METVILASGLKKRVESQGFPETVDCFGVYKDRIAKLQINVGKILEKSVVLILVDSNSGSMLDYLNKLEWFLSTLRQQPVLGSDLVTLLQGLVVIIVTSDPEQKSQIPYTNGGFRRYYFGGNSKDLINPLGLLSGPALGLKIPCIFEVYRGRPSATRTEGAFTLQNKVISNEKGAMLGSTSAALASPEVLVSYMLEKRNGIKKTMAYLGSLVSLMYEMSQPTSGTQPPSEMDQLQNHSLISTVPEEVWMKIFDDHFFPGDVHALRCLAATSKHFCETISLKYGRMHLCKVPALNGEADDKKGSPMADLFDKTKWSNTASENDVEKTSTGSLQFAATMLDKAICVAGGYYIPVKRAIDEKDRIGRDIYSKGDFAAAETAFIECAKLLESGVPFCKTLNDASNKTVDDNDATQTDIIPKSAGHLVYFEVVAILYSNAAQAAMNIDREGMTRSIKNYLPLALQYFPAHTKSLWRTGKILALTEKFDSAKHYFEKAEQSTVNVEQLRQIQKTKKKMKAVREKKTKELAAKNAKTVEAECELERGAIWSSREVSMLEEDQ